MIDSSGEILTHVPHHDNYVRRHLLIAMTRILDGVYNRGSQEEGSHVAHLGW